MTAASWRFRIVCEENLDKEFKIKSLDNDIFYAVIAFQDINFYFLK